MPSRSLIMDNNTAAQIFRMMMYQIHVQNQQQQQQQQTTNRLLMQQMQMQMQLMQFMQRSSLSTAPALQPMELMAPLPQVVQVHV